MNIERKGDLSPHGSGGSERQSHSLGFRIRHLYQDVASTPETVRYLIDGIRHPSGKVNHDHPLIKEVMVVAKQERLDVALVVKAKEAFLVYGKNVVDHPNMKKIAAGVAITSVVTAAGIILRKHRRSKNK